MIYFLLILLQLIKVTSLKNFRQRKNELRKEPVLNLILKFFLAQL